MISLASNSISYPSTVTMLLSCCRLRLSVIDPLANPLAARVMATLWHIRCIRSRCTHTLSGKTYNTSLLGGIQTTLLSWNGDYFLLALLLAVA